MSKIAIFELECCRREIAAGRFRGDEMYPPTKRICPFGCGPAFHPNGRQKGHTMRFLRYEFDDTISPELLATWTARTKKFITA